MNASPSIQVSRKKVLIYYYTFASKLGGRDYLPLLLVAELQRRGCDITLALDWESGLKQAADIYHVELDAEKVHVLTIKHQNSLMKKLDSAPGQLRGGCSRGDERHCVGQLHALRTLHGSAVQGPGRRSRIRKGEGRRLSFCPENEDLNRWDSTLQPQDELWREVVYG